MKFQREHVHTYLPPPLVTTLTLRNIYLYFLNYNSSILYLYTLVSELLMKFTSLKFISHQT